MEFLINNKCSEFINCFVVLSKNINFLNAEPQRRREKKMLHSQITENKTSASQCLSVQSNKCSKRITKI